MSALNDFTKRIQSDAAFAEQFKNLASLDEVIELAEQLGYHFTDEELDQITDIGGETLTKVAGGINGSPSGSDLGAFGIKIGFGSKGLVPGSQAGGQQNDNNGHGG